MTGFINDEEAAWYVQVAQGAHCRQKRACVADAAPAHNFPVPIPSKKLKTLDLSLQRRMLFNGSLIFLYLFAEAKHIRS